MLLIEYREAKDMAEPWNKRAERIRVKLEDVPSGEYGTMGLNRDKPRKILDQAACRKLLDKLGAVVPFTFTKPPIKVYRR